MVLRTNLALPAYPFPLSLRESPNNTMESGDAPLTALKQLQATMRATKLSMLVAVSKVCLSCRFRFQGIDLSCVLKEMLISALLVP